MWQAFRRDARPHPQTVAKTGALPHQTITRRWNEVPRQNVNRRKFGYWVPAVLIGIVFLFQGIVFYVSDNIRRQVEAAGGFLPGGPPNPYAFSLFTSLTWTYLFLFAAALTVGSACISADNRANALLVYLSKPLTRVDYLVGKWMGVFLLLCALSTLPAMLLYFFYLVAYYNDGFLAQNGGLWWRVFLASLLAPAVHASLITGVSAWSKTPRIAAATYAAFYFISAILAGTVATLLVEKKRSSNDPNITASVVDTLHVDGVAMGISSHLLQVTRNQALAVRFAEGGRRRSRERIPLSKTATPEQRKRRAELEKKDKESRERRDEWVQRQLEKVPERAPVLPVVLLGGAFIALPLYAAYTKIRAVEIIRG